MEYAVGVGLGLVAGALGTLAGFDRDRSFYPVVMIVIASYYGLFAVMGGSDAALWRETALAVVFAGLAIVGLRTSLWLVVIAIAGHGAMDFVHHLLVDNAGVPPWWTGFCATIDFTLAAYLAVLLLVRGEPRRA